MIQQQNRIVYKSELYILERDQESKKYRYSTQSYINILDNQLPKIQELGMIFMQDNTPIYIARTIKKQFKDIAILLLNQPPYSPDLNLIKYIQQYLKAKVLELFPKLKDLGAGEEAKEALERALIIAQDSIDKTIIESYIKSIYRRRDIVIIAKGQYIKYQRSYSVSKFKKPYF